MKVVVETYHHWFGSLEASMNRWEARMLEQGMSKEEIEETLRRVVGSAHAVFNQISEYT
jgi:hypothetical protein